MARKQGKAPFLPEGEFNYVLSQQMGPNARRDRAILLVSYNMGLRSKELAALRLGDVCTARWEIRETWRLLRHMTKGDKFREAFCAHEGTRAALTAYPASRGTRAPDRPLFLSQKGDHFSANTMQRHIARLYAKAGVKCSSHSGRRSFATRLMEKNSDIYAIQRLMGHESITTTQEYLYASPERPKKVVRLLE